MASSRAVLVLGMHRSGTSALARGVQALGVYLGNDFLTPRPDNPTGYWEDKNICQLNERLLTILGVRWEQVALISEAAWQAPEIESLLAEAADYVQRTLAISPRWGFKDPRTLRLLPFWRSVLRLLDAEEQYLVVIRNPLSVAASLAQRQGMDEATAHMLWLTYMLPLSEIADVPLVVADYDIVIAHPKRQLERIARGLRISLDDANNANIEEFANRFLDPGLRHNFFDEAAFDPKPGVPPLSREAYLWLRWLAIDRIPTDSPQLWSVWEKTRRAVAKAIGRMGSA
jgi:hypothetical protein